MQQVQALKQTILDEAAGTSNGLKASQQQRNAISKAVNGLVGLNPTENLTTSEVATGMVHYLVSLVNERMHCRWCVAIEMLRVLIGQGSRIFSWKLLYTHLAYEEFAFTGAHRRSALLNTKWAASQMITCTEIISAWPFYFTHAGTWNLVYTTTVGASGGKLGPFVGEVQQVVDIAAGLYINYVRLGPLTGELEATWEVVNKNQWKVTELPIMKTGTRFRRARMAQEMLGVLTRDYVTWTCRCPIRGCGG